MAAPIGWDTEEPFCGVGDPVGREDTANKYLRGLYSLFRVGHDANAAHKSGVFGSTVFMKKECGTYAGTGGVWTKSLTNSNLRIKRLEIIGDTTEYPVITDNTVSGVASVQSITSYADGQNYTFYNSNLYVSSAGDVDMLECDTSGAWSVVKTFVSPRNCMGAIAALGSYLYAAQYHYTTNNPLEILRYDGSSWTSISTQNYKLPFSLYTWDGYLYCGYMYQTATTPLNGRIMRSNDGTTWADVMDITPNYLTGFFEYDSELYVTGNYSGTKLWKTANGTSWAQVTDFPTTSHIGSPIPAGLYNSVLYVGSNWNSGDVAGAIYTYDGSNWATLNLKTLLGVTTAVINNIHTMPTYQGKLTLSATIDGTPGLVTYDGAQWQFIPLSVTSGLIIPYNGTLYLLGADDELYQYGSQSKEIGTQEVVSRVEISVKGEFTLSTDDAVNKSGEEYHYVAYGIEEA